MSGLLTAFINMVIDLPLVLGYLKGQAFHQPLSPEEEQVMIQRFLDGDLTARDELIERNMRLVAHVVKKFHPKHELLDDYISIGTIG
ncbi:MAG: RNA polymerase subunit sigma-70, partial [Psychrobacillus sp.]